MLVSLSFLVLGRRELVSVGSINKVFHWVEDRLFHRAHLLPDLVITDWRHEDHLHQGLQLDIERLGLALLLGHRPWLEADLLEVLGHLGDPSQALMELGLPHLELF